MHGRRAVFGGHGSTYVCMRSHNSIGAGAMGMGSSAASGVRVPGVWASLACAPPVPGAGKSCREVEGTYQLTSRHTSSYYGSNAYFHAYLIIPFPAPAPVRMNEYPIQIHVGRHLPPPWKVATPARKKGSRRMSDRVRFGISMSCQSLYVAVGGRCSMPSRSVILIAIADWVGAVGAFHDRTCP